MTTNKTNLGLHHGNEQRFGHERSSAHFRLRLTYDPSLTRLESARSRVSAVGDEAVSGDL